MEGRSWRKQAIVVGLFVALIKFAYIALNEQKLALVISTIGSLDEKLKPYAMKPTVALLAAEYRKACPKHHFSSIQLVSREPHIMLIEGFLTEAEAEFLVRIA